MLFKEDCQGHSTSIAIRLNWQDVDMLATYANNLSIHRACFVVSLCCSEVYLFTNVKALLHWEAIIITSSSIDHVYIWFSACSCLIEQKQKTCYWSQSYAKSSSYAVDKHRRRFDQRHSLLDYAWIDSVRDRFQRCPTKQRQQEKKQHENCHTTIR
jgi:hypothetical protein